MSTTTAEPPGTPDTPDKPRITPRRGPRRRLARTLARHPRARLGLSLSPPLFWLLVVYIGALVALLITSLFRLVDDPTGLLTRIDTTFNLDNYRRLWEVSVYRDVTVRTLTAAVIVTIVDAAIALPGRLLHGEGGAAVGPPRTRGRGDDAAVGGLPGEGLRVARPARPGRRRAQGGVRALAGLRADEHHHRAVATCGSRTW